MDIYSEYYIKVRNLRLRHFRKSSITLNIRKGEVVAVTGESGSGKSMLLKYLAGILRPSSNGVVKVDDLDLYNENDLEKYHRICGMAFQNPEDNFVFDNLETDLRFGFENIGVSYDAEIIEKILRKYGIPGKAGVNYPLLSGGEKRRASILSSLMFDPEVVIFDNALSNLDNNFRNSIFAEQIQDARENGKTFIFSSNDDEEIKMADRVIEMRQGDVISDISTVAATLKKSKGITRVTEHMRCKEEDSALIRGADGKKIYIRSFVYNNNDDGTPVIRLRDASFFYRKRKTRLHILEGFNYDFKAGRLYIISGRSGAGKSTFLKLLSGLLHAKKGNVYAFGRKFPGYGKNGWQKIKDQNHVKYLNNLRKRIGYLGQYSENQLIERTVEKDILYGPLNFGCDKGKATHLARVALRNVKLDEKTWKRSPFALSGGEKRKAALAGAIAMNPDILILDEPYRDLDLEGERIISAMISEYLSDGKTVIVATNEGESFE